MEFLKEIMEMMTLEQVSRVVKLNPMQKDFSEQMFNILTEEQRDLLRKQVEKNTKEEKLELNITITKGSKTTNFKQTIPCSDFVVCPSEEGVMIVDVGTYNKGKISRK